MPEGDSAFGQIVGGKLEGHFVAGKYANAIATQTPREVGKHYALMFQLNTEESAGEFLEHGARYFNTVFLTHSTSFRFDLLSSR